MKDSGKTINNMVRVKRSGTMELKHTKESFTKAKSKARVNLCGVMAPIMKETLLMVSLRAMEYTTSRTPKRPIAVTSRMER
jgi:hypothetical protein